MNSSNLTELLQEMGFSSLEAEIYRFLLQHSPATGYKVAKGIERSFTNTYKALESLANKGAVLVEQSESRLSRAVPVEELLDQLETRFRSNRERVLAAARELPRSEGDDRIYHLSSVDQIYERYRQMLGECEERALSELSPGPLAALREAVESAGASGRTIAVRTYAGEKFEHARAIHSPMGEITLESMHSQWLSLFVDGRQFLIANLNTATGEVFEAIWSANTYLAREMYSFVNADLFHYSFAPLLRSASSLDELLAAYDELEKEFPPGGDLGFAEMVANIRGDRKSTSPTDNGE